MIRTGAPALAALALAAALAACGADKDTYVRENERILATLPEVPGAERRSVEHQPYFEGDSAGSPPAGWTTGVTYRAAPEMTDADVIDFYVDSMDQDWRPRLEEVPITDLETGEQKGVVLLVSFTRGTAVVSISTDNMYVGGPHTFEVVVDHEGAR